MTRFLTDAKYQGSNTIGRINIIQEGVPIIINNNLFGLGSTEAFENIVNNNLILRDTANFFIHYGLRKGIIYMGFIIFVIYYLLADSWRLYKKYQNVLFAVILSGFIASFIGLSAYSGIANIFPIILIFYFVICEKEIKPQYKYS